MVKIELQVVTIAVLWLEDAICILNLLLLYQQLDYLLTNILNMVYVKFLPNYVWHQIQKRIIIFNTIFLLRIHQYF